MNTYTLKYFEDGAGSARVVEFEGVDAGMALRIAQAEQRGRRAELWDGTRLLCRLYRATTGSDYWVIEPI